MHCDPLKIVPVKDEKKIYKEKPGNLKLRIMASQRKTRETKTDNVLFFITVCVMEKKMKIPVPVQERGEKKITKLNADFRGMGIQGFFFFFLDLLLNPLFTAFT